MKNSNLDFFKNFAIVISLMAGFSGSAMAEQDRGQISMDPSEGRLGALLKTPDLIYDQKRRDPKLIQQVSGYTGVNNGGGGEIRDETDGIGYGHRSLFAKGRIHGMTHEDYYEVYPFFENAPLVTEECESHPNTFFPEFPQTLKETFDLRNANGEKLKAKDICDDPVVFNAYAKLTHDLWSLLLNQPSEAWDFIREIRELNKKPIEIHLTKEEKKIGGGKFFDPSWFDAKSGVIYFGYIPSEKVDIHPINRRRALGLLMNEMAHLYTWLLLPQYPQITKWHDFTTFGPNPKVHELLKKGLDISWSKNSYQIQTSEIAALFESFSNMTEYFSSLNTAPFNPFIAYDQNIRMEDFYSGKDRCCFYYVVDERFQIPTQQLVQNEAYISTALKRLITRSRTSHTKTYGFVEPEGKPEGSCGADDGVIYALVRALRMILTDPQYRARKDYLFYQWMEAFDKVRIADGYADEGTKLVREYFFYDMKTHKSTLDQFELGYSEMGDHVLKLKAEGRPEDYLATYLGHGRRLYCH